VKWLERTYPFNVELPPLFAEPFPDGGQSRGLGSEVTGDGEATGLSEQLCSSFFPLLTPSLTGATWSAGLLISFPPQYGDFRSD